MGSRPNLVRLAVILVTVASLGLAFSPGLAGASHTSGINAKGTTMCFVSGTLKASPALTLGSGKATTLTLSATLRGCTGSAAAKIVHATLSGKSTDSSASCVALENGLPPLSGKVSYKTLSGSLAQTKLAFSGGTLDLSPNQFSPLSLTYPKSGGTGVARGSFPSKNAKLMLNLGQTHAQWTSSCQSSSGLATMTVIGTSNLTD